MSDKAKRLFQTSEFAELAGVTVRTLHHYDRLGLLKPSGRTAAGYRVYGESDFARLQQIVTLKFIGFPLKQIRELLDRKPFDLPTALRQQRQIIAEKRKRLGMAIEAIERAEGAIAASGEADWEAFRKIIEVVTMQNNMDWTKNYYSEEAKQKIAERAGTIPREVIEQGQRDWAALIKEVEASLGEDPASDKAQALAERWSKLIHGFTGGDPAIQEGLNKMYADQSNWPPSFPKSFNDEAGALLTSA